jgi:glycosyltransferase involved in cell wall biosynthesis
LVRENWQLVVTTTKNTSEKDYWDSAMHALRHHPQARRIKVFVDHFTPEIMPEVYRCSDCVVILSEAEGLGLVGVEALASGVICVGRKAQGTTEYLQHEVTGLVCESGNAPETARLIYRALFEQNDRDEICRRGRALVMEKFCLQHNVASLEKIYRQAHQRKIGT